RFDCDWSSDVCSSDLAIIAAGVKRVVAAIEDRNPLNSGRGFERLGLAGIEVVTDICEEEARRLNEPFACWIRTKKPFVTLKSALTLDGQLALPQLKKETAKNPGKRGGAEWITSEESRAEVHRMRHASDALLTGIGTILADDPLLTDRSGLPRRRRLLRVVLDRKLRLPSQSRLVETADDALLVFTGASTKSTKARELQNAGVEIVQMKTKNGRVDLHAVLDELGRREILSVLLEAGSTLNGAALAAPLSVEPASSKTLRISRRPNSSRTACKSTRPFFVFICTISTPAFCNSRALVDFVEAPVKTRRASSAVSTRRDCDGKRSFLSSTTRNKRLRRGRPLRSVSSGSSARIVPIPVSSASDAWRMR